jgi:DNA polymerase IV
MPRLILHIDFNSFFASVEAQANPFLRGKAFAVAGKGKGAIDRDAGSIQGKRTDLRDLTHLRSVVTTASREAKNLGIKTAMGTWQALRIIPNLPIIPGDPRKYSDITNRFLRILHERCDAVEQFSTDEAFADITTAGGDRLGAILLAQMIRADIIDRIGATCTASIGIAPNKVLAKLASESVKPNGITYVSQEDAMTFVASRKIEDICGIGPRLQKRLEGLGVISILSLRSTPLDVLIREFGPHTGNFLWNVSRGIGDDHVSSTEDDPKSVGHSYTFPRDLLTLDDIHSNLLALADMVARRLRTQDLRASTVTAFARYGDFGGNGFSVSTREPIADGLALFSTVFDPLVRMIDLNRGVRLLGITTSNLVSARATSLFRTDQRRESVTTALDLVTKKYGASAWRRASTLNTAFFERVSGWHYDVPK